MTAPEQAQQAEPTPCVSVGIIGCGNMGGALARGILTHPTLPQHFPVTVFDNDLGKMTALQELGAAPAFSLREIAQKSSCIILGVKPYQTFSVLQEIKGVVGMETTLVSLAVGVTIAALDLGAERSCAMARIMPNTLVSVGQGIFGMCLDDPDLQEPQKRLLRYLFSHLGQVVELPEAQMNAFSALAGCGPAYMFYFADALVEAGVAMGLARPIATSITVSLLGGSAALAQNSQLHLVQLREQVTSPGGTTIAATTSFDENAVRGHIIQGILQAFEKGKVMENN